MGHHPGDPALGAGDHLGRRRRPLDQRRSRHAAARPPSTARVSRRRKRRQGRRRPCSEPRGRPGRRRGARACRRPGAPARWRISCARHPGLEQLPPGDHADTARSAIRPMIRSAVSACVRHYGTQVPQRPRFAPGVGWRPWRGRRSPSVPGSSSAGPSGPASSARARSWRRTSSCCGAWSPGLGAIAVDRYDAARAEADAADARIAAADEDEELPPLPGRAVHDQGVDRVRGHAEHGRGGGPQGHAGHASRRPPPAGCSDLGAIPLGVTNTSELTMWIESVNRVYGRTNNAYDAGRTAGGSLRRRGRRGGQRRRADRPGLATSAARSGCPRSSTACSATSAPPTWCPTAASGPRRSASPRGCWPWARSCAAPRT